jgi:type VI secretion system protein VasD
VLALCVGLISCKSAPPPPPPPKPLVARFALSSAADTNPDSQSRPSPIVIRLYQIKDDQSFKSGDYFALFDREQATLQSALIARQEFELAPGETRTFQTELPLDAHYLAVAAAFRDIRNARWRDETPIPPPPPPKKGQSPQPLEVAVSVRRASVSIALK